MTSFADGGVMADCWRLPPARGAFCRPMVRALRTKCRIQPRSHLVVAVSGGADSTALLLGLAALAHRPFLAYRLTVAHVHHHLRSEADQEAAGVRDLAQGLGLDCHRLDIVEPLSACPAGISAAARESRYSLLTDLVKQVGADGLVTAHHGDDQLETILMGLMRGAGLRGMAGMAWRSDRLGVPILRPLLWSTHAECQCVCRESGVHWFEDSSNANTRQLRNRIRAEVIPAITAIAPDLSRRASRLGDQLRSAAEFVEMEAQQAVSRIGQDGVFGREALAKLSDVVLGAVLRHSALRLGACEDSLTFDLVSSAIDSIRGGSCCQMDWPDGLRLVMDDNDISLCPFDAGPPSPDPVSS